MKRNFRLIWMLIKYKLSRTMAFRASFWGTLFVDGLLFFVQLLIFHTIYAQVGSIGGWSYGQMVIFVGTFTMIDALNMAIYFFGVVGIPGKIKTGDLDTYLTKPVNPLMRLTFESVSPDFLSQVLVGVLIVCYGVAVSGAQVSMGVGLGYAALVLLMTLLWYDLEVILRTIPFFVISAHGIMELEGELIMTNFRIPGVLYRGFLKILFYFILPYGIMSTVPTQFITGSISPQGVGLAVLIVVAFTVFTLWFWKFGLRHYKSASS